MKQSESFSFNLINPPHLTIIVLCITLNIALKYIKMFGWSILFLFMKLFATLNNWYFYKSLHLHLTEAAVFVQKPPSPY